MIRESYLSEMLRCARTYPALLALCAVALLNGCGTAEKEPEPVVAVQVVAAKRAPIAETVSSDAVLFPLQQAVISPKITSTIRKFYVQRGSQVKQGQLLAELENADLASAAEQSKGEYEQAEANYSTTTEAGLPQQIQKAKLDAESAKAAYDAQKKIYDARRGLFEQGAIPRRDLDTAEVALVQARSQNEQAQKQLADLNRVVEAQQLKSVSGQLSAAKGKYLNAQAQLSYSEIRSPIDGVITERTLHQGELATANQPILTVMNTSKLVAKAHIAQAEATELKVGDVAELHVAGVDDPLKGKVTLISPALDPGSTTIEVWIEVGEPGTELKPGMSVSIDAIAKSAKDVLVVPRAAVFKSPEGQDYVMVAGSDGKAHQANVKVGIRNKEFAEITSGVEAGSSVITVGGYALPDNTKITVESASAPESAAKKDGADKDKSESADRGRGPTPAKDKE